MPQVPVYGDRQVRTQATQPVFQNTPDVSSGARALAQGLSQVAEVADRIDLRNAETKANATDFELTKAWNQWEDANRGKFTNQAADGYAVAVDAWWKEAAKTYGADLDPRARTMVGRTLQRRQGVALEQAGRYEFAEKEKYADSTTDAAVNTATVNALKTGDYVGESQRIRELNDAQALRKNWDKDQRDAARNQRLGVFNTAVVSQLAERDAGAAQTYLTGAIERGEIKPEQQPRLEVIIKGEADNQFAKVEAPRINALPPAERAAALAKITDPNRLAKTRTELNNIAAVERQQREQSQDAARDEVYQRYEQRKPISELLLGAMGGPERTAFENMRRERAKQAASGTPVKTDWAAYEEVRTQIADGTFKGPVSAYSHKLAPGEIEKLIDLKTKRDDPKKAPEVASAEQQLSAAVQALEYRGEKAGQFKSAAYDVFNEFLKKNKREPDTDERREILQELTKAIVLKKRDILWDVKGPAYTAPRDVRNPLMPTTPADKFTVDTIYTDAAGNRAKYLGAGKWEPIK